MRAERTAPTLAMTLLLLAAPPAQAAPQADPLWLGGSVAGDLGPGESRTYGLRLEAGQFVRIVVEPQEIPFEVTLSRPDGRLASFHHGVLREESLATLAEVAGDYRVRVAAGSAGAEGPYLLQDRRTSAGGDGRYTARAGRTGSRRGHPAARAGHRRIPQGGDWPAGRSTQAVAGCRRSSPGRTHPAPSRRSQLGVAIRARVSPWHGRRSQFSRSLGIDEAKQRHSSTWAVPRPGSTNIRRPSVITRAP